MYLYNNSGKVREHLHTGEDVLLRTQQGSGLSSAGRGCMALTRAAGNQGERMQGARANSSHPWGAHKILQCRMGSDPQRSPSTFPLPQGKISDN